MKRTVLTLLSVLIYLPIMAAAHFSAPAPDTQTKVLQASKDNTLIEVPANDPAKTELSSGKGDKIFVGRTGQSEGSLRRALIEFDIAGAIPAGSKITSATVKLKMVLSASGPTPAEVTLHRVKSDWGEGASSSQGARGAEAAEGDATWLHPFYKTSKKGWARAGGDFEPKASASQTVSGPGVCTWDSTPALVADAQGWLDSPKTNFGWLLRGDETKGKPTAKVFESRDSEDEAGRPQLIVTFIPPASRKK